MKTEDLIRGLAVEPVPRRGRSIEARLALAVTAGVTLVVVLVLVGLGVRPDLGTALATPAGALKVVGPLAIAAAAFPVACRLGRPGLSALCPISTAFILVVAAVLAAAFSAPGARLGLDLSLPAVLHCTEWIFLLAVAPLAAALLALRPGAPSSPAAAGAVAGLLAGGLAAAGFALSCPMDDPGDVAVGYGAAVLLLSACGAVAGRRVLAW